MFGFHYYSRAAQKNPINHLKFDETGKRKRIQTSHRKLIVYVAVIPWVLPNTWRQTIYSLLQNATANWWVGTKKSLEDEDFDLHIIPPTSRETSGGTSTVLGWDSHIVYAGIDKEWVHSLSGTCIQIHYLFQSQTRQ